MFMLSACALCFLSSGRILAGACRRRIVSQCEPSVDILFVPRLFSLSENVALPQINNPVYIEARRVNVSSYLN